MLNPDGVRALRRYNANGVDLNRNFDVEFLPSISHGSEPFSEPESKALRDYSQGKRFHLSATYHSGAVVVNMPFDYGRESEGTEPGEYTLVKKLALIYTTSASFLDNPDVMNSVYVDQGTVNGGDWYVINGSIQDWSYKETGCIDLTVEVAQSNPYSEGEIKEVFHYNRDAMLAYVDSAGDGVYGHIKDSGDNPVYGVEVSIDGGDIITTSDENGYYHKVLMPGTYTLNFHKEGGVVQLVVITIPDDTGSFVKNITITMP